MGRSLRRPLPSLPTPVTPGIADVRIRGTRPPVEHETLFYKRQPTPTSGPNTAVRTLYRSPPVWRTSSMRRHCSLTRTTDRRSVLEREARPWSSTSETIQYAFYLSQRWFFSPGVHHKLHLWTRSTSKSARA